jgi:hypothetical protein
VSRADKIATRAAQRRSFLASRSLICCECGVRFIDDQLAQAMRDSGVTDVMCDDCSWDATAREVEP